MGNYSNKMSWYKRRRTIDLPAVGQLLPAEPTGTGVMVEEGMDADGSVSIVSCSARVNDTADADASVPESTVSDTLVALYAYDSPDDGGLSVKKNDQMQLLDDSNADWWYVRNVDTREQGYVPRNFLAKQQTLDMEEWYAGRITTGRAERLVLQGALPRGTFLIRECQSNHGEYLLTIRDSVDGRYTVKHYKINRSTDICGYFIRTGKQFDTLQQLVRHYTDERDGLCCRLTFAAPLTQPITPFRTMKIEQRFEIARSELDFDHIIAVGHFGEVWYGKWRGFAEVAIKMMKPACTMSTKAFLEEARIMKHCHHANLLKLYAVCTKEEPIYIVTEYMSKGSLLDYMRKSTEEEQLACFYMHNSTDEEQLSLNVLVDISAQVQVANGMSYLEGRKLVHRDLAARNVLVGETFSPAGAPTVKIADFGLARKLMEDDIYEMHTGTIFPVKWTAPEAALNGRFSCKSDVWSYGVLLYEVMTKGQQPYPGMGKSEVISLVESGYRMPRPLDCPKPVYGVMLSCWQSEPQMRPTFDNLYHYFDDYSIAVEPKYEPPSCGE